MSNCKRFNGGWETAEIYMIQDYQLQAIITSMLLIASSDGALNENDKKIITSYLNKHYKSGDIVWNRVPIQRSKSPFDEYGLRVCPLEHLSSKSRKGEPYDILKKAVDTLNTTDKFVRHAFFHNLYELKSLSNENVVGLWNKIAGDSEKRNNVLLALYQKVFIYQDFD